MVAGMIRQGIQTLSAGIVVAYLIWLHRNWRRARSMLKFPAENPIKLLRQSPSLRYRHGVSFKSIYPMMVEWGKKHREDGIFVISTGHPMTPMYAAMVIVCDLGVAKQILHRKSYTLFKKGWSYRLSHPLVGNGLLSADDGDHWKAMRDLTAAGFTMPSLERAVTTVAHVTSRMMERWRREIQVDGPSCLDIYEEAIRLTLDVLGHVALSYNFQSVTAKTASDAPLFSAFQSILTSLSARVKFYPLSKYIPSETNRCLAAALEKLNAICQKLVQDRRMPAEASSRERVQNDTLQQLLSKDEHGQPLLEDVCIMDCVKTLLFAGHDTTASSLTWALYMLAVHSDWQDRLRKGLAKVGFKPGNGPQLPSSVTYQQLDDLAELTAFVKETLRIYPPAGFTREAVEPIPVQTSSGKEYDIHPGHEIFFFPGILHSDPNHFQDPEVFRPERWFDASPEMKEAYLPFSTGMRNCVGSRLAMTELRIALALLLTNFRFDVPAGQRDEPFQILLLSLQPYGVKLCVTALD